MDALLYQIYDWQRAAMEPWRVFAQAANEIYGHPDSPLSHLPGSRNVAAAFDLMTRITKRYERPVFGIHRGQRTVRAREIVVLRERRVERAARLIAVVGHELDRPEIHQEHRTSGI